MGMTKACKDRLMISASATGRGPSALLRTSHADANLGSGQSCPTPHGRTCQFSQHLVMSPMVLVSMTNIRHVCSNSVSHSENSSSSH